MNKKELIETIRPFHKDKIIFADLSDILNTFYMAYDDLIDLIYALNRFMSIDADQIEKELDDYVETIKSAIKSNFIEKKENGELDDTAFEDLDFDQLNQDQILEYYAKILNDLDE